MIDLAKKKISVPLEHLTIQENTGMCVNQIFIVNFQSYRENRKC